MAFSHSLTLSLSLSFLLREIFAQEYLSIETFRSQTNDIKFYTWMHVGCESYFKRKHRVYGVQPPFSLDKALVHFLLHLKLKLLKVWWLFPHIEHKPLPHSLSLSHSLLHVHIYAWMCVNLMTKVIFFH
jgi:hypothetical protein